MIGNRGYAMYIRDWVRDEQKSRGIEGYYSPRCAPADWKYLGQGCFRAAYVSPDGVVYKVQHDGCYGGQSNTSEYRKYNRLRIEHRMPEGARFPVLSNWEVGGPDTVNAMEYVGKTLNVYSGDDYYKYSDCLRAVSRRLRLWDMHHGNAAVDEVNKLIVPIDLG